MNTTKPKFINILVGLFLFLILVAWTLLLVMASGSLPLFGDIGYSLAYMLSYFNPFILFIMMILSFLLLIIILCFRPKVCMSPTLLKITLYAFIVGLTTTIIPVLSVAGLLIPFLFPIIFAIGFYVSLRGLWKFISAYRNECSFVDTQVQ